MVLAAMWLAGCPKSVPERGQASWYGPGFAGNQTASGDVFRPNLRRTAAHKTLPFGTVVRVKRMDTGRQVRVVVNDRGPFVHGRIIDVSRKAARVLDMVEVGVVDVEVKVVGCRRSYPCGQGR